MLLARVGDATSHGGVITSGLATIRCQGLPIALVGTSVASCSLLHGASPVVKGSATVFAAGVPLARVGDVTGCGAQIITGVANVFIRN